jgi:lysine-specific permease
MGIAVSHWRFRRAFVKQNHDLSELKYRAKWFPFGPLFAFVLSIVVILGQDINSLINLNWQAIGITYMSVPLFIVLFAYYKIKYKTKLIPLEEIDLSRPNITKK